MDACEAIAKAGGRKESELIQRVSEEKREEEGAKEWLEADERK